MSLTHQVFFGSALLILCSAVHLSLVIISLPLLRRSAGLAETYLPGAKAFILLVLAFLTMVFGHTVQIWLWAVCFLAQGIFAELEVAFYFSLVTYTTLGYGDIVLDDGLRVFGAFASITGLLTFGISTALLLGVIVRVLPVEISSE